MTVANARVGGRAVAHPTSEVGFYNDFLTVTTLPRPLAVVGTDENRTAEAVYANRQTRFAPARPATFRTSYTLRNMHWRAPWNTGIHGVVSRHRPGNWHDRQREFYRAPRFLRSAPAVPWDAGTAIGADGRRATTGVE